jgi:hypothetical protein
MLVGAARCVKVTSNGCAITVRNAVTSGTSWQTHPIHSNEITLAGQTISMSRARSTSGASEARSKCWALGVNVTQVGRAIAVADAATSASGAQDARALTGDGCGIATIGCTVGLGGAVTVDRALQAGQICGAGSHHVAGISGTVRI